ncbi:MAG TPA: hypothetical protein VIG45_02765 [Erysipelothrix sp.]
MNKLKLAHDYFMKHGNPTYLETDVAESWSYADRMIEQEQLREDKTRPDVLRDKEWQPDWSQAPGTANYWAMDCDGLCNWYKNMPQLCGKQWDFGTVIQGAHHFNYSGDWRESLRKRP